MTPRGRKLAHGVKLEKRTVALPPDVWAKLDAEAARAGLPAPVIVRETLAHVAEAFARNPQPPAFENTPKKAPS